MEEGVDSYQIIEIVFRVPPWRRLMVAHDDCLKEKFASVDLLCTFSALSLGPLSVQSCLGVA